MDVRIITATNKDLQNLVRDGLFREDLYYRLNVMPLSVPPLRQRPEDIPLIADFLLNEIKTSIGKKHVGHFTEQALKVLSSYEWPGNVRELRNIIERAVLLCQDGDISDKYLVLPDRQETVNDKMLSLSEVERSHIERILQRSGGNKTRAAQILGIARSTLNEKIKQLNLN